MIYIYAQCYTVNICYDHFVCSIDTKMKRKLEYKSDECVNVYNNNNNNNNSVHPSFSTLPSIICFLLCFVFVPISKGKKIICLHLQIYN